MNPRRAGYRVALAIAGLVALFGGDWVSPIVLAAVYMLTAGFVT